MSQWFVMAFMAGCIVGATLTGVALGWRCDAEVSGIEAAGSAASLDAYAKGWQLVGDIAAIDRRFTHEKELQSAEIDRLAGALAAGDIRLHVHAACETARSTTPTSAGVDHEGAAELTGASRRGYPALVEGQKEALRMIRGCHAYITKLQEQHSGIH